MQVIDPFAADAFTLTEMVAAINHLPHKPGRLGELGLFAERGVTTTTVMIEEKHGTLELVGTTPRGGPGETKGNDKRKARTFAIPHLQRDDSIMADEILGVRAFGQSAAETITMKRDEKLAGLKSQLDMTLEYHRMGALKGLILDKDGSTIYNLFTEFGVSQQTIDMVLDNSATEVRAKCFDVLVAMEDALGGLPYTGAIGLCGDTFWSTLITHKTVKETYANTAMAGSLRADPREVMYFGGIAWERYRGKNGATPYVGASDAYVVPTGVPGMFQTVFAPADYTETVGTIGLPYYAKTAQKRMDKGLDIEAQSNPLNLCTIPRAVVKVTV